VHGNLGYAFQQLGRFDDALTSYHEPLELNADCPTDVSADLP
jgi:Flp pilus assembly protein TadD